mgnify:FL=1
MKYYFTYGTHGQPFSGGWTVVNANSYTEAIDKFNAVHPKTKDGFINCAFVYDENEFKQTKMYTNGNFGKFEQEVIV